MSGSTLFSIGEALIDMIPSRVGCSFDEVPSFSPRTGGAPANVCAAFARLGGKSAFLSQLGDDPFGHKIARELEACGIDLSHLAFTDKANTALAFVSLEEDGSRTFSFYRKPSADLLYSPEQIDPAWFADAFALHYCSVSLVDSPMRYAHLAAISAAREAGAIVSFDPNLRFPLWPDRDMLRGTVLQFLPLSNILKISDEELEFLTGTTDIESALPQLLVGDVRRHIGQQVAIEEKGNDGSSDPGGNGQHFADEAADHGQKRRDQHDDNEDTIQKRNRHHRPFNNQTRRIFAANPARRGRRDSPGLRA